MRQHTVLMTILLFLVSGTAGVLAFRIGKDSGPRPAHLLVEISARKYAFDPSVIRVTRGDTITLRLKSEDVVHGFYLEGYDLDARIIPERPDFEVWNPSMVPFGHPKGETENEEEADVKTGVRRVREYSFIADKVGKYRYRCSHTCGYLHPFMQGELIVSPNYLYRASLGIAVLLAGGLLLTFSRLKINARTDDEG